MAAEIRISPVSSEAEAYETSIHLLPCKIRCTRDAKVSGYFETSVRTSDQVIHCENEIKNASFRGRPLQGRTIEIPPKHQGLVLKEGRRPVLEEEERNFVPVAKFNSICYWNLDNRPSDNDSFLKALQWMDIANVLHGNSSDTDQNETLEQTQTDR